MKSIISKFMFQELNRRYSYLSSYPLIKNLKIINSNDEQYNEELLKIIMVKYFPNIKLKNFREKNKLVFFETLYKISYSALSSDYRFLDVFNNVYEVIQYIKWSKSDYERFVTPFLKVYKFLLWSHLKKYKHEQE